MSKTHALVRAIYVLVVAVAAARAAADDGVSQSATYRLQPTTLNAGGRPAVSSGARAEGSLGQALAVGTSSAPHYVVQSGFWGFAGSGLVPVVLSASRTQATPASVDLSWSGNNAPYDLYRATSCAAVFGSVFASTSNNAYTDASAPTSGLTCYNVLAFAPGPAPPPAPP